MRLLDKRYGRKLIAFLLCLFLLSADLLIVAGAEPSVNRTAKAGIFYFDGYHMKDEEGDLTGYGIEFLDLVSKYSHLNFEYVGYDRSWNEMLDMLEDGQIDVVTTARRTPEREERFAYSMPIGQNDTILTARADDTSLRAGERKGYDGMTVGVLVGSSQNQSLVEFAIEKGFSYKTKEYQNAADLEAALQNGSIDAILSSNLRKTENEKILDTIASDNFYAIVRKEDQELLEEINYAIKQMDINEGDWANVLYYKYYGPVYHPEISFTEREQAYIQEVVSGKKTITATALCDRKPYSYVENGELKGILPDYFADVMELAGLPYEVVVTESRAEYHALTGTNGVDVVIDKRDMNGVAEDERYRGFTTEDYMTTGVAKVTRKDAVGPVSTVAVAEEQGGAPIEAGLAIEGAIVHFPTRMEALQAVLEKKVDAAYVHTYTAQVFVDEDATDSLQYSMVNDARVGFKMYVRDSCDHELVTILDKCIRHMPEDTLNQLITRYTANTPEDMTFARYMRAHPQVLIVLLLAVALAVVLVVSLYLRDRWNQKVIDATERSKGELEEQLAIVDALSRDYLNVLAIDGERAMARIVKMYGYVVSGMDRDQKGEFPYEDFLHRYIQERVYIEDQPYLKEALSMEKIREKMRVAEEYVGSYRVPIDGQILTFQFTCVKVERKGRERDSFILAGFRNIDEMIRKEQEQKEILSVALAEAQHANKSKTTFLNNMSHDIRTPMNAIIGFTTLAVSHIGDKELVLDHLKKIMTSSNHLLNLINDVLDMSRIESGKVNIEEQETSLARILDDLKTIVQSDVQAKQLVFSIDTVDLTDDRIICDKLRLEQVLLNILSNAIKYTRPGGKVQLLAVQTKDAPEGYASYQFYVRDTGIGMSQEFIKHIFEPFEREQTATVSGIQGTGLGLAITKNIVDMMGGTISVTSEAGKGTEFVVSFQFQVADPAPETDPQAERRAAWEAEDPFTGKKVLLVEDNELNQEIAQTILEEAGFLIDTADDGTIAVEKMEAAAADTYDVILMDIQMPIMDGYMATRAIRKLKDPAKASIPIVAMTANAFEEDRQKAMEAGMNGHVAKPIDIDKLMGTLETILSTSR